MISIKNKLANTISNFFIKRRIACQIDADKWAVYETSSFSKPWEKRVITGNALSNLKDVEFVDQDRIKCTEYKTNNYVFWHSEPRKLLNAIILKHNFCKETMLWLADPMDHGCIDSYFIGEIIQTPKAANHQNTKPQHTEILNF